MTNDNISASQSADGIKAPYPTFNGQLYRALRPFPQYDYIATDCCLQNVGHSSYEALVVSLNRRFRQGLNLQSSYTWSKNLTDADSALPNTSPGALQQDQNVYDHRLEKSVSISNIPHTFVVSYLYELPFGRGRKFLNKSNWTNYLIGGWQIGGIQRYQSGQPVSFGCASAIPGYQNCIRFSRGGALDLESAGYKRDKLHSSSFNNQSWFSPAYLPSTGPGNAGVPLSQAGFVDNNRYFRNGGPFTLGQGIDRVTSNVNSPHYLSEDFSVIKKIPITEGVHFELKGEAIDAFNRHNFNIPDLNPGDPTFGIPQIGSIDLGPRVIQLTGRISF